MTFPHEFIFLFILCFIVVILLKMRKVGEGVHKKDKKGGWPYWRVVYRRSVQTNVVAIKNTEYRYLWQEIFKKDHGKNLEIPTTFNKPASKHENENKLKENENNEN